LVLHVGWQWNQAEPDNMERPAAAISLAILLICSLPAARGGNAVAADYQTTTVRIFGEEGCKNKDDFSALKRLGDAFQRDLKPVLSSGLMTPEKFDAMYEMSDLNQWLKQHEVNGSCLPLKDGTEVVVDDKNDQMICVRPQGEPSCFWIRGTAIRPDKR
jgi:hypothetical protein